MMQRIAQQLSLWLMTLALSLPVLAEDDAIDWPTFQGNNARTGASGYPAIKTPEIAWSTQIGIMGYLNCPVIDADRVFITSSGDTHNESDPRDGVYCLDMNTGEILWHHRTQIDACGIAINDAAVFVGDDGGSVQAIDRKTGEAIWKNDLEGNAYAMPLILGNLVIVGDHLATVFACDIETGEVRWLYDSNDRSGIRGALSSDGEHVYAAFISGQLSCLDRQGNELWTRFVRKNNHTEIYPAPTIYEGSLYFGFARGTYYDVPALGCFSTLGQKRWVNEEKDFTSPDGKHYGNIRSSAVVYKDTLIYAEPYGNRLVWVSRETGKPVHEIELGAAMFPHWPSPVIAGETLYIPRHDGGLYAVDLKTRKEQWMLYLGDHAQVGQKNLRENILPPDWDHCAWKPNVGEPIYATPAIAKNGSLVIGTGAGWLYCIKEK